MKLIGKAPRGALYTIAMVAVGVLLAACGSASSSTSSAGAAASGSSSSTTTGSASSGAGGGFSAERTKLETCLKAHGVTLPTRPAGAPSGGAPGGGTPGTGTGTGTTPRPGFFGGGGGFARNPKMQAALKACGANFNFRGRRGFTGRLSHTAITKYVDCVRQHGYNLPNPNFSGKGPIFPANIETNAKFQAASKSCQSLLVPARPSGSGGGTSTNSGA